MSSTPRSIRFDDRVNRRLRAYVASHPGSSSSSAANLFVDEALRMEDHPGVIFRDGPSGRRAVLMAGPDVWEIVRAVKSARVAEPRLDADAVVALVESNTGVPGRQIHAALRYWAAFPDEIDAWISAADDHEAEALATWQRQHDLLTR